MQTPAMPCAPLDATEPKVGVMQLENVLYFLVFAGLFFLMMRFGCGAHITGHAHLHSETRRDDHGDDGNLRWLPPNQAADPVCGMTVQTAGAKSTVLDGDVYYFCSQDCRKKFGAASASYVKLTAASSQQKMKHHGCC